MELNELLHARLELRFELETFASASVFYRIRSARFAAPQEASARHHPCVGRLAETVRNAAAKAVRALQVPPLTVALAD